MDYDDVYDFTNTKDVKDFVYYDLESYTNDIIYGLQDKLGIEDDDRSPELEDGLRAALTEAATKIAELIEYQQNIKEA